MCVIKFAYLTFFLTLKETMRPLARKDHGFVADMSFEGESVKGGFGFITPTKRVLVKVCLLHVGCLFILI
jgi:hypothetical protein